MFKAIYTLVEQSNVLQLPLSVALRADVNFTNFYTAKNETLINKIQAQIENHENDGAIFFWGKPSSGKTHVLQAISDKATELKLRAVYIPLSVADELDVEMLKGLEFYDVICIDDIDNVAGNNQWEKALFELYHRAQENQSQMYFSSSCAIKEIPIKLQDLSSRLSWGLVFQLQSLSDEDMPIALQMHAKARGFELPDIVVQYLLKRYPRNMTKLLSLIDELDKATLTAKRKITIPFVKEWLEPNPS